MNNVESKINLFMTVGDWLRKNRGELMGTAAVAVGTIACIRLCSQIGNAWSEGAPYVANSRPVPLEDSQTQQPQEQIV